MADRLEQLIEMECADALLDSGVSVPLKRWKLPWLKRPVEVRVTYTVCRGYVSRHVGIGVTAWVLRNFVEWRYLTAMFRTFERLMGTKDFMRIISSTARANPMTPRLSQARKGS